MNSFHMIQRYEELRKLAQDTDQWLESKIGSDLWVDGINVFLTIEHGDFVEGLEQFQQKYTYEQDNVTSCLRQLQLYARHSVAQGEFALYQALAVGMTWLSLQEETNGLHFNLPVQITNHSIALLLSPTYLAVWANSYNAGIELFLDVDSTLPTLFRPEHGKIYQNAGSYLRGENLKFPFQNYFHEIAHILLFHDVYQRVLGSEAECRSYWTHIEGCIYALEEQVLSELMEVQTDLHVIDDGYGNTQGFEEFAAFRIELYQGNGEPSLTGETLRTYVKRGMQLGEGNFHIPDNAVKQTILSNHELEERELELLHKHCFSFVKALQAHSAWGVKSYARNTLPAFRETVELLPAHAYCMKKLEESLQKNPWTDVQSLFSSDPFPPLDSKQRKQHKQLWKWRELMSRLAEIRGYLEQCSNQLLEQNNHQLSTIYTKIQQALLPVAKQVADWIRELEETAESEQQHQIRYESVQKEISEILQGVQEEEGQNRLLSFLHVPYSYVLEPH
ncbi:hypothetical protein C2W64_02384 [Brevibacillus laterosporus]|uniref:Uncharacterized protein n=1 Tax=Brevibacillus laterosporus TaxID=1465 RepID=A0A518VEW1_BRELA|nr:hypothetical protein [Brevibacillus laterosporus]QDX95527.1 hypothetical protein EEL30_26635 [Brevibacillus laterosporus]RAP25769.1 hypothetical protein C2W64_02384 [Brevibacillus laterosporus]